MRGVATGWQWGGADEGADGARALLGVVVEIVVEVVAGFGSAGTVDDGAEVEEDVVAAIAGDDEAEAFSVVPVDEGAAPAHGAGVCPTRRGRQFVCPKEQLLEQFF